ncbi:unnamed protein product [Mycena citricolor]|uniref:Uncharacterized protein n=1 Tax=Mycena citricolor TaxID=2018698 RepID=A0AAD2H8J2_9AGAR|nr:unnamed protein product [Mycena citricolor]
MRLLSRSALFCPPWASQWTTWAGFCRTCLSLSSLVVAMPLHEMFHCELYQADLSLDGTTAKKDGRVFHQAQLGAMFPDDAQTFIFNCNDAGVFSCTRCAYTHPNAKTFGDHLRRPGRCPAHLRGNQPIHCATASLSAPIGTTEHAEEASAAPLSLSPLFRTYGDTRSSSITPRRRSVYRSAGLAGQKTVAVRMPSHPVARVLIALPSPR